MFYQTTSYGVALIKCLAVSIHFMNGLVHTKFGLSPTELVSLNVH